MVDHPWTDGNAEEHAVLIGVEAGAHGDQPGWSGRYDLEHRWIDEEAFRWRHHLGLSFTIPRADDWLWKGSLDGSRRLHRQAIDGDMDATDIGCSLSAQRSHDGDHRAVTVTVQRATASEALWSHSDLILAARWSHPFGSWTGSLEGGAGINWYDRQPRTPRRMDEDGWVAGECAWRGEVSPFIRIEGGRTWSTISAYDLPWWSAIVGIDWIW